MRTKMHLAIKKTFSELETKTIEESGKKYIQVLWRSGENKLNGHCYSIPLK